MLKSNLTSGKKSCGNFDFSFVLTASIFPEWTSFPLADIKPIAAISQNNKSTVPNKKRVYF